ncbi:lysophospholipid acyltransferase family protein [Streptomyces sp. NPDC058412]|uniref:lysophospholipid acyltransferase family protein n=1 Tax=Streptomyces sp. NPDC058412 TaxID=3346486 RepID=UPI003659F134
MRRKTQSSTPAEAGPSRTYVFGAVIVRTLLRLVARREWRGARHLPAQGGYIVALNHISHVDPFAYGHFQYKNGLPPRFLVKSSVFSVPAVGAFLRATGQIPVERNSHRAADALHAAVAALERGRCVAIYPEGTLTSDPDLWPGRPKTGAARLALSTGTPVIPVAQWGAHKILPPYGNGRRRLLPRPTLIVAAGPPVDLSDFHGAELTAPVLRQASERIMDAVTELLEEIREEKRPTPGADSSVATSR